MNKINLKKITLENLAALISEKLKEHKIDSILVGGGCVSIYSQNRYQSYDLDYVVYEDIKKIEIALKELGFKRKNRNFEHKDCKYLIEFVSPPAAIGNEPIREYEYHHTKLGTVKMLTPTDSVKDRLAGFYHWDDRQSLDQAINICEEIFTKIDIDEIRSWSKREKQMEKFEVFFNKIKRKYQSKPSNCRR